MILCPICSRPARICGRWPGEDFVLFNCDRDECPKGSFAVSLVRVQLERVDADYATRTSLAGIVE